MYREALVELEKAGVTATSDDPGDLMTIGRFHARAGHQGEALQALERMECLARAGNVSVDAFAMIYAALGRRDEAFAWLEKGYKERRFWLIFLRCDSDWEPLRGDPRFADLARRIGIPESSQAHL
jgi:hypothetical protein